jgi:hypothetical protein
MVRAVNHVNTATVADRLDGRPALHSQEILADVTAGKK